MKKLSTLVVLMLIATSLWSQQYAMGLHRKDGRLFSIKTEEVDSINFGVVSDFPIATFQWTDTIVSVSQHRPLNILAVGNSFSMDALAYMPMLTSILSPETDLNLGIIYVAGCSLERHWKAISRDSVAYDYWYCKSKDNRWTRQRPVSANKILDSLSWDVVIFQQNSSNSYKYNTCQPYLDSLVAYTQRTQPRAKLAWLLTQAYADGYGNLPSDEMYEGIAGVAQKVYSETPVSTVIPVGTAIQNGRQTPLDSLGKFGHLAYDGYHLHAGIPILLANLMTAYSLLPPISLDDIDIEHLQFPSPATIRLPIHGTPIDVDKESADIIRQVVANSISRKFGIWNDKTENTK